MSGLIKVMRRGAKKPVPLFSRVDEAAQELPRTKGTGKEFMAELKKQPGVKKAELEDRKLSSLESAPKMTKEEFVKKLNEKPAPKIKEDIKSNPTNADLDARAMELIEKEAEEMTDDRIGRWDRSNSYEWLDYKEGAVQYLKSLDYDKYLRQAKRDIEENVGGNFPKFQDWKLPGGENYREILLRLPKQKKKETWEWFDPVEQESRQGFATQQEAYDARPNIGAIVSKVESKDSPQNYKSSHWEEPNVLAHIRVQDRVGPNGEKILHVEEIQSDWHQAGRKKGYGLTELPNKFVAKQDFSSSGNPWGVVDENGDWITSGFHRSKEDAQAEALKRINAQTVPDAPFKKNWHELATKRIMDYAIQNGYDKVAITPGAEQASRYSLSKSIDEINVTSRTHAGTGEVSKSVALDTKDGKSLRFGVSNDGKIDNVNDASLTNFMGKSLDEVIGKDMAKKILEGGTQTISGEGLTVGGEGMKGFYDQILPAYINKEYGKYGSQVNMNSQMVPVPDDEVPIHTFDITPQMREDIQSKGQPLYQAVGIGLTGAAAAPKEEVHFSDNPDAMMMEMEDKGFAGGGLLRKAARASAKEAATPAVNRVDMNYKDVTKRVPELTEAAKKIPTGELSAEEYAKLVNQFKPVTPYKFVPQPATEEDATRALTSNKKAMFGKTKEIPAGQIADLRLDIPAYKDHGVWVNSVHRKDEPTVYGSVSSVKNATMFGAPEKALRVATGEAAKGPWAVISGEWNPIDEADAVKSAQKYLKHKDWRQVGYDPERHGYFYDRETMAPVVGAEEVIQIGPLVLAKKPTLGDAKDFPFREGGEVKIINKVQGALTKAKRK